MASTLPPDPWMSQDEDDRASTIHPVLSDKENTFRDDDNYEEQGGNYSSRMEEFLSDEENDVGEYGDDGDDSDEVFVYTGVDAASSGNYGDQLRDVLGGADSPVVLPRIESPTPGPQQVPSTPLTPYLHPTISRLRAFTPQATTSHVDSPASNATFRSRDFNGLSSPSHFSDMSHSSCPSEQRDVSAQRPDQTSHSDREVFRWAQLRSITNTIYPPTKSPPKAKAVLGSVLDGSSPDMGSPRVLAANGMVCIGTSMGRVYVFNFKQSLRCVCGGENSVTTVGAVTCMSLSHDHTFLATGHATGHIQLFDLSNPQKPARHVPPITLAAVRSGRHEGHLEGSRIVSIGFVGGRHTAVVTADDRGLAFYHSLGRMLFIDAPDILRILGKYPEREDGETLAPRMAAMRTPTNGMPPTPAARIDSADGVARRVKSRYTILAMMPLPLGTAPHSTDNYNVIALLTPTKLVVVGLKPTPRTWFKCPREKDDDDDDDDVKVTKTRTKGALAWYPSVPPDSSRPDTKLAPACSAAPRLVYSWANFFHLISVSESKIKQKARNTRTGKVTEIEVGTIVYETLGKWRSTDVEGDADDILALQWLNANQIIVLTTRTLQLYDVNASKVVERVQFDSLSLVSPTFGSVAHSEAGPAGDVAHSMRVYKGKIFLLLHNEVTVGTLLTWADRILSFVEDGDFLSAIELLRSYYIGEAPGNTNGLPDNTEARRNVLGERMRDLMTASMRYAFSEERMTDGTHVTPDGRGVDRTSLFEGLVSTCARACIALDDLEFLFEDLFQHYDDHGISGIFLTQLEPFVLDNQIRQVPPRITQRLVALHDERGQPDLVERVIWHIDPACLDINQAIHLCQRHHLYDALIYVYTRAMRDYVSPVVELLELIRRVHQYRKSRTDLVDRDEHAGGDAAMEPVILNAYKIYPYLADVLSGLSYPSEERLGEEEAFQAKKDVYTFLFFGRSSVWPVGEGGKLVLTADEEGGVEPTFPYARTLLRFDAESFLHTLDIAFEDSYLNDKTQRVSRLVIVKTLLEILASKPPPATATFVNIFIARNVPKYTQFIQIAPSALQNILVSLAEDFDPSTREDRQLAAEYLLSVYTPHESERMLQLFDAAGFFRILRSWHRQDRRWASLLSTYLRDPDLHVYEVFANVDDVLDTSTRLNKGVLPHELLVCMTGALPQLLLSSVTRTASVVDKHAPQLHQAAFDALGSNAEYKRFSYLRHLLGPPRPDDDEYVVPSRQSQPSPHIGKALRQRFIALQCQYDPAGAIDALKHLPSDDLDWAQVLRTCEDKEVYDVVVWALNWRGDPQGALSKAEVYEQRATLKIVTLFSNPIDSQAVLSIEREVKALESIARMAMGVCLGRSHPPDGTVSLEDVWFQLLRGQINSVHTVLGCRLDLADSDPQDLADGSRAHQDALSVLRALLQESFAGLVSISSTRAVSFPRLFTRLVDSAAQSHTSTGSYTEFRTILTGMLESYRSEGDMLMITKHLVDRDRFDTVEAATRERGRGWLSGHGACSICRQALVVLQGGSNTESAGSRHKSDAIVVSRTGATYHEKCSASLP